MNYKLLVIRTSGEVEKITVSKELELEVLQSLVSGYIECVPTAYPHIEMLVNEEGRLDGLAYNEVATKLQKCRYDMIVGDAVLCKIHGDRLVGLTPLEASMVIKYIRRKTK